jgi:starch synthase
MAAGRAIVASDAGGLPELIADGANGLLAKSEDAAAFVRQIEAAGGRAAARAARPRGAPDCRERYTDVRIAEQSLDYYRHALKLGG